MVSKYIGFLILVLGVCSCSSDSCEQDFFFFNLNPEYSLESESLALGESFRMVLEYTDTLSASAGTTEIVFDTTFDSMNEMMISSRQEEVINTVDIKNYQFITSLRFKELIDTIEFFNDLPNANGQFDISVLSGEEAVGNFDGEEYISFNPGRSSSISRLELLITPQNVGSYYISMIHGNAGVFTDVLVFDGCDDLILTRYENTGPVNENVLFQAIDSNYVTENELQELIDNRGLLFFKVES